MKALTLTATGGLEHLELQDVPEPTLHAPDDVRVRLHAAALNRLDLFVADGLPGLTYHFPHIMGSDGAGVVERTGPAATGVRAGDRVFINPGVSCGGCEWCDRGEQPLCAGFGVLGEHRPGTLAEYVVVPARNLARMPDGMPWPEAAGFSLVTLTAWRMLVTRARLVAGETVLIWGIGGGVSLAALKIAREIGARTIVTSSSEAKLARARELGADETINHATMDVPKEVRARTARRGADVVVDSVGEKTWEQSLRSLARMGRLVTCGGTSGPMVVTDVRKLFWYQWTILGSTMGNDAEFAAVTQRAQGGRLWPEVDAVFPLARAPEAFRRLAAGAQLGKVVIEVGIMNELMDRLAIGWNELMDVLPGLLAAAVVMLAGYFIARQLQRWTDRTLERMHFKRLADAGGFTEAAGRVRMDPVRAVGKLVFWLTMLVVVLLASSALGLENVREMFSRMLSFIPTLISATVIIILGMIVGEFVRALIVASAGGVEGVITVAKLTKGAMVAIAVFMALQQVGVSEEIVTSAFTLVLGSIALAAGLAFGLGNRQLAGEVTRRWYEEGRRRNRRRTDPPEPLIDQEPIDTLRPIPGAVDADEPQ